MTDSMVLYPGRVPDLSADIPSRQRFYEPYMPREFPADARKIAEGAPEINWPGLLRLRERSEARGGARVSDLPDLPRSGRTATDLTIIEVGIRIQANMLLFGPTGLGKTSAVLATCSLHRFPYGFIGMNGMATVDDVVGQIVPTETVSVDVADQIEEIVRLESAKMRVQSRMRKLVEGSPEYLEAAEDYMTTVSALNGAKLWLDHAYRTAGSGMEWHDGVLTRMMLGDQVHEHTVFCCEEINFGAAKVMAIFNSVLDKQRRFTLVQHRSEPIPAHDGFAFVATMNPGYAGTHDLNEGLKNRFRLQLPYNYDPEIEKKLFPNHPNIVTLAQRLRLQRDDGSTVIETSTSTRALENFVDNEGVFGTEFAREAFVAQYTPEEQMSVNETIVQHLGKGLGTRRAKLKDEGAEVDLTDLSDLDLGQP